MPPRILPSADVQLQQRIAATAGVSAVPPLLQPSPPSKPAAAMPSSPAAGQPQGEAPLPTVQLTAREPSVAAAPLGNEAAVARSGRRGPEAEPFDVLLASESPSKGAAQVGYPRYILCNLSDVICSKGNSIANVPGCRVGGLLQLLSSEECENSSAGSHGTPPPPLPCRPASPAAGSLVRAPRSRLTGLPRQLFPPLRQRRRHRPAVSCSRRRRGDWPAGTGHSSKPSRIRTPSALSRRPRPQPSGSWRPHQPPPHLQQARAGLPARKSHRSRGRLPPRSLLLLLSR